MTIHVNLIHLLKDQEYAADITSDGVIVAVEQDALTIMEEAAVYNTANIILHQENIAPEFFDLKSGLAGAVLQKFVNYHMRVAIVGDFTSVSSTSLRAFIVESNRGSQVFFVESVDAALQKLSAAA